jgi:hypothetical protein
MQLATTQFQLEEDEQVSCGTNTLQFYLKVRTLFSVAYSLSPPVMYMTHAP